MSGRTYEEIRIASTDANRRKDIDVLEQCASEYEALGTDPAYASASLCRGNASMIRGEYNEALAHYHHALSLFETTSDRNGIASTVGNIGIVQYNLGAFHAALEAFQKALSGYEAVDNTIGVALFLGNIGNVFSKLGRAQEALVAYDRALHLYQDLDDPVNEGNVVRNLAIQLLTMGDHPTALDRLRRSLEKLEALNDQGSVAVTRTGIGNVYLATGDYPAALDSYRRALEFYEALGYKRGIASVIDCIGNVYARLGNNNAALEWYERSVALHREMGDMSGLAYNLDSVASIYQSLEDHTTAIGYYEEAIAIFQDTGEMPCLVQVIGGIVVSLTAMGRLSEAREIADRMEQIPSSDPFEQCSRHQTHATLNAAEGLIDDAMTSLHAALALAQEHSLRPAQAAIHAKLRDLCQTRNDFAGYIQHNNEYTRITEEVNGKETATKLAMQEKQREIDAREREHEKQLAVLHSTLPKEVAERVARGEVVNDHYENAAVIFLDIVGFTDISSTMSSQDVIALLDDVFSQCDAICKQYNVTKIKTIGDSYMCVAFDNVINAAHCAVEMNQIQYRIQNTEFNQGIVQYRIGMHCGPVTAGVIGKERFQYDVWGDTVNIASRMESTAEAGRIQISEAVATKMNTEYRIQNSISESDNQESHEVSLVTRHLSLPLGGLSISKVKALCRPTGSKSPHHDPTILSRDQRRHASRTRPKGCRCNDAPCR